jgi:hypothetical protein
MSAKDPLPENGSQRSSLGLPEAQAAKPTVEQLRRALDERAMSLRARVVELRMVAAMLRTELNTMGARLREAEGIMPYYRGDECMELEEQLSTLFRRIRIVTAEADHADQDLHQVWEDMRALAAVGRERRVSRPVLVRGERRRLRHRATGGQCRVCGTSLVESQRAFCSVGCQRAYMEALGWGRSLGLGE